jgi:hypothetical protein
MDKIKINLDRTKLSSEYIQSKQNFTQITNQVPAKSSLFKSTWFYGGIGLASFTGILFLTISTPKKDLDETKITLAKANLATQISEITQIASPTNDVVAKRTSFEPRKSIEKSSESKTSSHVVIEKVDEVSLEPETASALTTAPTEKKVQIEPKKSSSAKVNRLPNIKGVYSGELALEKLCANGIEVNEDVQITSFKIQYATVRHDKIQIIQGNKIPSNICDEISTLGIDQMIFLTDILGRNSEGKVLNFTPMSFTCLIEE